MGVDLAQFLEVQPGRGLVDAADIEQRNGFVFCEDFLVAVAPAEA